MKGTTAFQIQAHEVQASEELSQNKNEAGQYCIIQHLSENGNENVRRTGLCKTDNMSGDFPAR